MAAKLSLIFHSKISKIDERLYLGDMMDAQNKTLLQKLGVTHILNMAKESPCFHPFQFTYMHVEGIDIETFDLGPHLHEAADFIAQGIKQGGVLAHCAYGISRGSSAVIAYLIKYRKMSYDEAKAYVQAKRSHISPNNGFARSLKKMQTELGVKGNGSRYAQLRKQAEEAITLYEDLGLGDLEKSHKRSRTSQASKKLPTITGPKRFDPMIALKKMKDKLMRQDDELREFKEFAGRMGVGPQIFPSKGTSQTNPPLSLVKHPSQTKQPSPTELELKKTAQTKRASGYCCAACGRVLAMTDAVVRHGGSIKSRCDSVFVQRQAWMQGDLVGSKKKLLCPNPRCKTMVGLYSQQVVHCCCGFSDNPAAILSLDAIKIFKE